MEKILVVDDDKSIRNLIGVYLRNDGYEVYNACNGQEALDSLELNEYDLII
ncbi:MAG TPA: response regulator [Candidatus Paceibacterota bacterium]